VPPSSSSIPEKEGRKKERKKREKEDERGRIFDFA